MYDVMHASTSYCTIARFRQHAFQLEFSGYQTFSLVRYMYCMSPFQTHTGFFEASLIMRPKIFSELRQMFLAHFRMRPAFPLFQARRKTGARSWFDAEEVFAFVEDDNNQTLCRLDCVTLIKASSRLPLEILQVILSGNRTRDKQVCRANLSSLDTAFRRRR